MVTMAGMGRALLPTGLVEGTRASRKCGTGPEGGGEAAGGHVRGGGVRSGAGCGRMKSKGAGRQPGLRMVRWHVIHGLEWAAD